MCAAYYEAGGGKGTALFLNRLGLIAYVRAEYAIFVLFLKFQIGLLLKYSGGNPPCQGLHDTTTLG